LGDRGVGSLLSHTQRIRRAGSTGSAECVLNPHINEQCLNWPLGIEAGIGPEGGWPEAAGGGPEAAGGWLAALGCWLEAARGWPKAAEGWLEAAGGWLKAAEG